MAPTAKPAKTSDVTNFLKFAVGLSLSANDVDEDDYVVTRAGERITLGDPARPVILYKENIKDMETRILNPFAEGIGETASGRWFYKLMRITLTMRVLAVMRAAIERGIEEKAASSGPKKAKKKGDEPAKHMDPALLNIVSAIVDSVDEKMLDELSQLEKNPDDLIYVRYIRPKLECILRVPLLQDEGYRPPPSIRKGSIVTFKVILQKLLDVADPDDLSKYSTTADPEATPKIDAYWHCLFKVYFQINKALYAVDEFLSINLGEFKEHLDAMAAYSYNAKSMVQPAQAGEARTVSVQTPSGVPSGGANVPAQNAGVPDPNRPGTIRIPGPMRADGTSGPPTIIETSGTGTSYYGQPQQPTVPMLGGGMMGGMGNMYGGGMGGGMQQPNIYGGGMGQYSQQQQPMYNTGPANYNYNATPGMPTGIL